VKSITSHAYKPCYYDDRKSSDDEPSSSTRLWSAVNIEGLCQAPSGPLRCHVIGCNGKESDHATSERGSK
jgi:hypothetical protein